MFALIASIEAADLFVIDELQTKRAPLCDQGSPRGKRQTVDLKGNEAKDVPYRWYIADETTTDGTSCEAGELTHNTIRAPIVVPYGKVS